MSPLSWPVLAGTLLVGSPALWAAQVSGTLSPDVAMVRLLICMGAVWAACWMVANLADRTVAANKLAQEAEAEALAAVAAAAMAEAEARATPEPDAA